MNELIEKFDALIIDSVNLSYKLFEKETPSVVSKKLVYKEFVKTFIKTIEDLKKKYLHSDGEVYLLFDNYTSRFELQSAFMYASRKEIDENYKKKRDKDSKEFYNSINLIRYYYLIGPSKYISVRVDGLEADDLVKPLLNTDLKDKRCLMVTSDLDWCRYISQKVYWLHNLNAEPESAIQLSARLGFKVNEKSIICFKAIFGDPSDNIKGIARNTEANVSEFIRLMNKVEAPEDLIMMARNDHSGELLMDILGNERQFTINLQLVSTINCRPEIFKANTLPGRNTETLYKSLREILGIESSKKFVFGNVKKQRV